MPQLIPTGGFFLWKSLTKIIEERGEKEEAKKEKTISHQMCQPLALFSVHAVQAGELKPAPPVALRLSRRALRRGREFALRTGSCPSLCVGADQRHLIPSSLVPYLRLCQ